MRAVLFFLKFVEATLSLACIGIHVVGFSDEKEPFPHCMLMCGTYFGFFFVSTIACIALCMGISIPLLGDVILNSLGALCFIVSSMVSMVAAEQDYHLMFLTDSEESQHDFFQMSRVQSITSLFAGLWFLMHTVLEVDMLCITEPNLAEPELAYQPLQLTFCCTPLINYCSHMTEDNKFLKRFALDRRNDRNIDQVI